MRLSLGDLAQTRFVQQDLGGEEIKHELLLQTRASGDVEMVVVLTSEEGPAGALAEVFEASAGSRPVLAASGGALVERTATWWGAWPGDARAETPVRMVVLNVTLPAGVDVVTLDLPSLGDPRMIAIPAAEDLPVEKVENGLSLALGVIDDAIYSRVTLYTDGVAWPPPLHIDTLSELGGARMVSFDGYVDAQLASWSHLGGFLAYEVDTTAT